MRRLKKLSQLEEIQDSCRGKLAVSEINPPIKYGTYYIIEAPFSYVGGDSIETFLEETEEGWVLSDNGVILENIKNLAEYTEIETVEMLCDNYATRFFNGNVLMDVGNIESFLYTSVTELSLLMYISECMGTLKEIVLRLKY